ncbi:MAG: hypothetical protein IKV25_06700 [Clostridia bacterium]|nr:hypothetical protein [Clostridia bacterium]
MKKLLCILLALCFMLTAFAGCNKDEDTKKDETEKTTVETPVEEPEVVNLVGVWNAKMDISEPGDDEIVTLNQTIEFKEDGTVVQTITKEQYTKFQMEILMESMDVETKEELEIVVQERLNLTLEDFLVKSWASSEECQTNPMGTWKIDEAGKILWNTNLELDNEETKAVFECAVLESGKPIQFVCNIEDEGVIIVTLTK